MPKAHRYGIGLRIDGLFCDAIEAVAAASYLPREGKLPHVRNAATKLDALRLFLLILWETRSLDDKKYLALSSSLDEAGRMLGGWGGQLRKQNSSVAEEK